MWRACLAVAAVVTMSAALGGCGVSGAEVASARMSLQTSGGLMPTDVGAVEILVLDGEDPTCAHALTPASPLDDPALVVVAHGLFATDTVAKHLSIPAGKKLVFYAEAYSSTKSRVRLGRGCAEQSLSAGASAGVTILISAEAATH
ncbi:MAG: hypothetical protein JWN44_975 [Myxococcales bacterium]|nr:hypothetical protein [Myxococcales bacterium]